MIAKSLVHQAILAGYSAPFLKAADLILDLTRQETAGARQHRLRSYSTESHGPSMKSGTYPMTRTPPTSSSRWCRYQQKSLAITTNLPFKQCNTVLPNATSAVALIDRLTHHAEIVTIGESSHKREAEQTQKRKQEQKPTR